MFQTSQDLLYLMLAFCVLWLTVFLCWALYYFIRILKQANETVSDFRSLYQKLNGFWGLMKGKAAWQGLGKLYSWFSDKKAKTKTKK